MKAPILQTPNLSPFHLSYFLKKQKEHQAAKRPKMKEIK